MKGREGKKEEQRAGSAHGGTPAKTIWGLSIIWAFDSNTFGAASFVSMSLSFPPCKMGWS